MKSAPRALVLAGGGLTGIGWEIGVLAGLASEGVEPGSSADLIIGTSAGAVVGARVAQGADPEGMYAEQLAPAIAERAASIDGEAVTEIFEEMLATGGDPLERHQRIGSLAMAAPTISESERLAVVASRLPDPTWPDRRLQLVAVDAESGEVVLFDATSGVGLVEAVAASCAVPGVWPPTTINGRRYLDGGVRSVDNADLAAGFERVLVLMPVQLEVAAVPLLESTGSVAVLYPDDAAVTAMGPNPLDPEYRAAAARAGRLQAEALALDLADFWTG